MTEKLEQEIRDIIFAHIDSIKEDELRDRILRPLISVDCYLNSKIRTMDWDDKEWEDVLYIAMDEVKLWL